MEVINRTGDFDILGSLQGIRDTQQEMRKGRIWYAVWLAQYYKQLPDEVRQGLKELKPWAIERAGICDVYLKYPAPQNRPYIEAVKELASDIAYEQVSRAVNIYRTRIGYDPIETGHVTRKEHLDGTGA